MPKNSRETPEFIEPSRRKKRREGPPPPRHTTHKLRAAWFQARASYPVREANIQHLIEQREQVRAKATESPNWTAVGPTNIGGRTTSLAVHPQYPDIIYIGSAGGGVWRSDDAGRTWIPLWHDQPVLNIGSLAIDPKTPETIYCGTGEANGSSDSYPGVGVFRTQDGGRTWIQLASAITAHIPKRIGVIAIDPFDSQHLILGGVTHDAGDASAMFVSTDGGVNWIWQGFVSLNNYWCHAVLFHPTAQGVIFATIEENGAKNGIWRTDDGGKSWQHLTKGLPNPSLTGRVSLAIAPSKPDTIYALAGDQTEGALGVFKSNNRGGKWTSIGGDEFVKEGQMSYGNTIVVHPTDPERVLCGGVDLHLTTDGGATWERATAWDADRKHRPKRYAHADHHALVMPAALPGRVYDANDGGMDVSEDGGKSWTNRSNGLAVTMFYDIDVAQTDGRYYGGGAQDNGSVVTTRDKADGFEEVFDGDGGWLVFDPQDAMHFYASCYNFFITRWKKGRQRDVTPRFMSQDEHDSVWMVYITLDPKDPDIVYTASHRVWKTINDGLNWHNVSPTLDGSPVTAIEVAPANTKYVYVGTEKGGVFRSTDAGATWSGNLASTILPGMIITRIETHPKNAKSLYVTVGGTGHRHVFRSEDAASTWQDADGGQLPDAPHNAIVILPDEADTMFVCSNAAVFRSNNSGANWVDVSGNLPNTMFVDLVYQQKDRTLLVGTYGRSIWRLKF